MSAPLAVGIDIGTATTKGVLADAAGVVLATATREHRVSRPRPGWAEHDPGTWWGEIRSVCQELLDGRDTSAVAGVCVSGVGPCVVVADADGDPLRPAILYGVDARATAEIAELTERLGEEAIVARGGSALSTQAVGPKLLWLQRHEPEIWAHTARWFMASSYIAFRLTGEYVLDHHSASQSDPLYDLDAGDWARDWAEMVAPGLELPRLAWPGERVGEVTAEAAAATGLPAGTPVMAGTVDAWAEAFSVGVRAPGDLMLMYGSTMFFVQIEARPRTHPALWATAGVEPGSRCLAAGMGTAGALTDWVRELTGIPSFAALAEAAGSVAPGAEGLLMLPYLAGERTPIADPQARGVIAGLTLAHDRRHVARAAYEALAFGTRHNLEALSEGLDRPQRVVAVGGGTNARVWTQLVSDVAGVAQAVPAVTIGAAYGDALLAAIGSGAVPPETDWTRPAERIEPDPGPAALYDERYALYRSLYERTRDVVHALGR